MSLGHRLTFIDHLDELRGRIILCLAAVIMCSAGAYFFSDSILNFLIRPMQELQQNVYFFSPYEAFLVKLKASLFVGVVLSAPVLIAQTWLFIGPGLYGNEKKMLIPGTIVACMLFLLGVTACYYGVLPFVLQFFLSFQSDTLRPLISIKEYISVCTGLLLSFGVIFNLPVMSAGLTRLGVIDHFFLRRKTKWVLIIIFIVAAVITPPDVFTQIVLAIPLIVLYELCIIVSWLFRRRKEN